MGGWSNAANFIRDLANYFTTDEEKLLLLNFMVDHGTKFDHSLSILNAALDDIDANMAWTETHLTKVYKYMENRGQNSAGFAMISVVLLSFCSLLNFML